MRIRYQLPNDSGEKFSEILALFLIIANSCLVFYSLKSLPEIVPNHFDLNGNADGFGSKYFIFGPLIFSILIYVLLTYLTRRPMLYLARSNKVNKDEEGQSMTKMLLSLKAILILVMTLINLFMIQTAKLKWTNYLVYLLVFSVVLVISHTLFWVIRISRIK